MAIIVYGEKQQEDKDRVVYKFGSKKNYLNGEFAIYKSDFQIEIIKHDETGNDRALFKIVSKIKKIFNESNVFPSRPISSS